MATTVHIIIKGVAICYKKEQANQGERRNFWRVLFPFDDARCHKVNFSWRAGDGPENDEGSLAIPRGMINITVSGGEATNPAPDETQNFTEHVLDMTNSGNTNQRRTHNQIKLLMRGTPPHARLDWNDRTVLMKINVPALFSVDSYLADPRGTKPILYKHENIQDFDPETQLPNTIAHTIKGTIVLPGNGKVTVTSGSLSKDFADGEYTITFDNDCSKIRLDKNDMDMFYDKTIFDPDNAKRRFIVGDRAGDTSRSLLSEFIDTENLASSKLTSIIEHILNAFIVSVPASLAGGKPCLVVKVSKSEHLPD